jgi:hypothetical protein
MVEAKDYNAQAVIAARSVLLEVSHILGEYKNGIVIVGGWVPELLFSNASERHVGSLDVDLALDQKTLQEVGYRSIISLLLARGYQQGDQPFIFYRTVKIDDQEFQVEVDFLTSEYGGTSKKHRTQVIQDMHPRKTRGCDLAFEMPVEITLNGTLPEGGLDHTPVRVVSIVPFIMMKAFALGDRLKEKDAYDIYYCLKYYPPGLDHLIEEFRPLIKNRLVTEGLSILAEKFASPLHVGPVYIADFEEISDLEDRAALQRDAYERMSYLLKGLEMDNV